MSAAPENLEALLEELRAMPLWKRSEILGRIAAKTGQPIYEIEKELREATKR